MLLLLLVAIAEARLGMRCLGWDHEQYEGVLCESLECVRVDKLCDEVEDCSGGGDETDCPVSHRWEDCEGGVRCGQQCIHRDKVCNKIVDCADGSDEAFCNNGLHVLLSDCLQCHLIFPKPHLGCVEKEKICDGNIECDTGRYEDFCHVPCLLDSGPGLFCSDLCLPWRYVCDGYVDCPNLLDEQVCCLTCEKGFFRCDTGGCLPHRYRCDGRTDCRDGSDEKNCLLN